MVLVTGGTGLVGAHLLYQLTSQGQLAKALKRETSDVQTVKNIFKFYPDKNTDDLFNTIKWVDGDITDYDSIITALDGVEKVYHAAAYVSFNPRMKKKVFFINNEGTTNLVNACIEKGVKKFCHVSSIGALGSTANGLPVDEETSWHSHKKRSNYSQSKFNSEMEVWRASKEGLPVVVINPGVILGPGQHTRSSGTLFHQAKKGFKLYPPGSNAFVDVRDVAKAMVLLMESNIENERYILTSENIPFKTLLNMIASEMNVAKPKYLVPRWIAELGWRLDNVRSILTFKEPFLTKESVRASYSHSKYSSKKFSSQLDYSFIPIEKTIEKTCKWFSQYSTL